MFLSDSGRLWISCLFCLAVVCTTYAQAPFALVREDGTIDFRLPDRTRVGRWQLYLHGPDWRQAKTKQSLALRDQSGEDWRTIGGQLAVPAANGRYLHHVQKFVVVEDGLDIFAELRFRRQVALQTCSLALFWETSVIGGKSVWIGTPTEGLREVKLTAEFSDLICWQGVASEIRLSGPLPLTLRLDKPLHLTVQDNREYGIDSFEFRFNTVTGGQAAAGERHANRVAMRFPQPTRVILDETTATSVTDTSDWFPWSCPWDAAPVDLSQLNDRPAGNHGFLGTRDDRMVFADGTEARFWGTNISGTACFPDRAYAPLIAERMARYGINLVRFHHGDAPWAERSFIDYEARQGELPTSTQFDAENLDRWHVFAAELRKRGIYIYLDNLVHRKFLPGDGVPAAEDLPPAGKPYALFHPRLIELQKAYARHLWTTVNPYTGLAPRDDPQFVLSEYSNEHDFFTQQVTLEPYRSEFEARYREWAADEGERLWGGRIDFTRPNDTMTRFFQHMQRQYHEEMRRFFREDLQVRIPLTGSNWARTTALLWTLQDEDFTEAHAYADHPWDETLRIFNHQTTSLQRNIFAHHSFNRLAGKPFVAAEWDQSWPNEWRAELPLLVGAVAALQGWSGAMVYTYRHEQAPAAHIEAPFEAALDPARFGLFPHAALLYRRDVTSATTRTIVAFDPDNARSANALAEWDKPAALSTLPEQHRLEVTFADPATSGLPPADELLVPVEATAVRSETGQLWRSWEAGYGTIDTPGTQAVYGQRSVVTKVELSDLQVDVLPRFATVVVSSLTEQPIRQSTDLLLTTVARAENSGTTYNIFRTLIVDKGEAPILAEPVHGTIELATEHRDLEVVALDARGEVLGTLPSTWRDGTLSFQVGEVPTLHYRLRQAP